MIADRKRSPIRIVIDLSYDLKCSVVNVKYTNRARLKTAYQLILGIGNRGVKASVFSERRYSINTPIRVSYHAKRRSSSSNPHKNTNLSEHYTVRAIGITGHIVRTTVKGSSKLVLER